MVHRRDILKALGAASAASAGFTGLTAQTVRVAAAQGRSRIDPVPPTRDRWEYPVAEALLPFGHGVASGDPLADRVIIWTRITIPSEDGWLDPMPQGLRSVDVSWVMAHDPDLRDVVASGAVTTDDGLDWTVKVDVDGLASNGTYFYAFICEGFRSPVGRTRTAPAAGDAVTSLHVGHVACASWWGDFFSSYARIGERPDLDLLLHVGDHVYEFCGGHPAVRSYDEDGFDIDHVDARRWSTMKEAGRRYALYYQDANLMSAHLAAPWIIAVDNHDFADVPGEPAVRGLDPDSAEGHDVRRFGGAEVFWLWTPTRPVSDDDRATPIPSAGHDAQVPVPRGRAAFFTHRELSWGDLASFIVIDFQYTLELEVEEQTALTADELDGYVPSPQMLGTRQWRWLMDTLADPQAPTHRVILNQKNMGQLASPTVPSSLQPALEVLMAGTPSSPLDDMFGWQDADRRTLFRYLRDIDVVNTIVLTGDSHGNWGYDLVEDSTPPDYNPVDPWAGTLLTPVGVEVITGMGRPGLVDVAAEAACEALADNEPDSCFGIRATPEGDAMYEAQRTALVPASIAAETAGMAANPNMKYFNWRQYGHTMLHLYPDRSELELYASDRTVDVPARPADQVDASADQLLARFTNDAVQPSLQRDLAGARAVGSPRPQAPTPRTVGPQPTAPGHFVRRRG